MTIPPNDGTKQIDRTAYDRWLNNEYSLWVKALQSSTVHNFKEHPQVQRMLSDDLDPKIFKAMYEYQHRLLAIDNIGRETIKPVSGACLRMAYYALKILLTKDDGSYIVPTSIVEIGGGVGQFYAVLRTLGYEGEYGIIDLPEVEKFQREYLKEVEKRAGILLPLVKARQPDFCVSFYALGEFTDEVKAQYVPLIKSCPHGLILWNAHSGATEGIPFECTVTDEDPKSSDYVNVKMLTW